ncbi:MAG: translation initiation factor IF-2 subunit beta [Euryarchaeota archaeon]|nr:translation initiation factor IF-2 subunit beta [Euryarchaeota archaeon]
MGDYEALLDRAYSSLPETLKQTARFEKPEIVAMIQGKQTVVQNLGEVSKAINRPADMLAKYLIREFGTSGTHDQQHLVMKGVFRQAQVQEKLDTFLEQFVMCPDCGRPDTKILQERRVSFLKCEACGSRHPLSAAKRTSASKTQGTEPRVGEEVTLEITGTGKRGDGITKMGNYIVFVKGAKKGQRVRARITGIQGTMIFATAIGTL